VGKFYGKRDAPGNNRLTPKTNHAKRMPEVERRHRRKSCTSHENLISFAESIHRSHKSDPIYPLLRSFKIETGLLEDPLHEIGIRMLIAKVLGALEHGQEKGKLGTHGGLQGGIPFVVESLAKPNDCRRAGPNPLAELLRRGEHNRRRVVQDQPRKLLLFR
jgi:hypothetical protein